MKNNFLLNRKIFVLLLFLFLFSFSFTSASSPNLLDGTQGLPSLDTASLSNNTYYVNYTVINSSGNNLSWYETNYTNFRPLINLSWWNINYTANDDVWRSWSLNYSNFTTGWHYAINSTGGTGTFWNANYSNFSTIYGYALNDTNWNATGLIANWSSLSSNLYVPYIGATDNLTLGKHNLSLNGSILFEERSGVQDLFYVNPVDGDGFRMAYYYNFEVPFDDWLVFQKTDGNDMTPDGGIAFMMSNATGWNKTILKLDSYGLANFTDQNITTTQNVTAGFFFGDGRYLTNIPETLWNANYSNFSTVYGYALNGTNTWANNYSNFSTKIFAWDLNYSNFSVGWDYALNDSIYLNDTFRGNLTNFTTVYAYALNDSIYLNDTFRVNYTNFSVVYGYSLNSSGMSQSTYNTNYTDFRPLINLTWYTTNYTNFRPLINSSGNNLSWYETNYTDFRPLINLTWYTTNYTANDALYRSWSLNFSNFSNVYANVYNGSLARTDAANTFGNFNQSFNATTLFVNSIDQRVGIGTSKPGNQSLTVYGATNHTGNVTNGGNFSTVTFFISAPNFAPVCGSAYNHSIISNASGWYACNVTGVWCFGLRC